MFQSAALASAHRACFLVPGAYACLSHAIPGIPSLSFSSGVILRLGGHDVLGRLEYAVRDLETNGVIDFSGTDRITRTVTVVTNNGAANVTRVSSYEWATTNLDAGTLTSVNETSTPETE
ncbi:MAG TPA: hypothetical protein VNU68_14745 [Verrucomicrobiae bacterium]|nr:hypothetical protein [Verrucomicrobiae bacterium]